MELALTERLESVARGLNFDREENWRDVAVVMEAIETLVELQQQLAVAKHEKQHNYESSVGWRDRCLKAERERDEYQAWYELRDAELVRLQDRLAALEQGDE